MFNYDSSISQHRIFDINSSNSFLSPTMKNKLVVSRQREFQKLFGCANDENVETTRISKIVWLRQR